MGVTPLPRYYGHSDFPPGLLPERDLRVYAHRLPSIPPPNTPCPSVAAFSLPHKLDRLPAFADTWLRHFYAGSPRSSGRIGFVILRTGRSPPVAPHLALRQRSYSRLQAGERLPGEDFHLSDDAYSHAHVGAQHAVPLRFFRGGAVPLDGVMPGSGKTGIGSKSEGREGVRACPRFSGILDLVESGC